MALWKQPSLLDKYPLLICILENSVKDLSLSPSYQCEKGAPLLVIRFYYVPL